MLACDCFLLPKQGQRKGEKQRKTTITTARDGVRRIEDRVEEMQKVMTRVNLN
jgi:hypothetical protein